MCAAILHSAGELHNRVWQELSHSAPVALGVHDVTHDGAAKLKTDAHRTASGTQGRLRGALTSQEIAKYV